MSFADKLKILRAENKMTQEFVAQRLNVARSTIAGYETKSRQPSHDKLASIAALFHVSVDYLLDDGMAACITMDESQTVSDDAQDFLTRFQGLSPDSQKELLDRLQFLEIQNEIESAE